ncbi:hypothetical protein V3851_07390 [Paenibacillus sp. M1]|uniref:Virion structural protein n=1 Tax=Paenibacillus haidiansis TaxID=1574488 RepID=A0ABU7VPH0_9BACL
MTTEFLGVVELGGLYKDGDIQRRPEKPWRIKYEPVSGIGVGDIPDFTTLPDMTKWLIGDTPERSSRRLRWNKIKTGEKTLLISDRVILARVSWDDLNSQGWVTGRTITIDGQQYICRLLTGGSNFRDDDFSAGGSPANNEWDRFITREEAATGLPIPTASELDTDQFSTNQLGAHNQVWNWFGMYSWVQEAYVENASYRAVRGYYSARYWNVYPSSNRYGYVGWRPALEVLNTDQLPPEHPSEDKAGGPGILYQVGEKGDSLTITDRTVESIHYDPAARRLEVKFTSPVNV